MIAAPAPPGFFGKLPSRGDFVTRRLPADFVGAWDGWLQNAVAASRAELGGSWLEVYLTSPIWRFALAPGVCGSRGSVGVMIPSVDKVGRYFPLAVAACIEQAAPPLALAIGLQDWFTAVEELMLATLAETPLELESFDARLAGMPPSASCSGADESALRHNAVGSDGVSAAARLQHWRFPDGRFVDALAVLGAGALTDAGSRSAWWSQGSERIEPCVLLAPALPEPHAFAAMLDGGWSARGWREGALPIAEKAVQSTAAAGPLLRAAAISHAGKVREVNEDAWGGRDDGGVWLVADGLGGHQAGEVASRMVVAALDGVAAAASGPERIEQLARALQVANGCLRVFAQREEIGLAASTVAALVLDGGTASCVWAGDSRIYRLRDGRLEQLSTDHSEAAGNGSGSRAVTRAVGGSAALELEVLRTDARIGDRFLLCTDGVYSEIDTAQIAAALGLPALEQACAQLRDAVLAKDARDNLTAVVVHVGAPTARTEV